MNRPIEAVLFDLDGLLVDSEPAWYRARKELAAAHGKEWTEADQRAQAGVHTDVWVENVRACLEGALSAAQVQEEIVSRMEAYYLAGEVGILPGAMACIEHSVRHFRTALASGSPRRLIDAALRGAGWAPHFEEIISSDEVARGKPAPDVYLEVLGRLGVSASKAVVLEDSGAGIRSGKAAGTIVVAVPNPETHPGPQVLAEADHVMESLFQFATLFPGGRPVTG